MKTRAILILAISLLWPTIVGCSLTIHFRFGDSDTKATIESKTNTKVNMETLYGSVRIGDPNESMDK